MSANTVGRRIENVAVDWKKQVPVQISQCETLAVQLDENTDVSNMSQFMVFARFSFNSASVSSNTLRTTFCEPLKERTSREAIFSTANYFFNKNILWKCRTSLTMSGAAALTRKRIAW